MILAAKLVNLFAVDSVHHVANDPNLFRNFTIYDDDVDESSPQNITLHYRKSFAIIPSCSRHQYIVGNES